MFWDVLRTCVSPVALAAALRLSCPLIIGSTGGCFNEKISTGNLAYECFMLTGAFFGAWGSYLTGSPLAGSLLAIASGLALAAIYGILVYHLNCNAIIVSIAYNNAAWALTTLMLVVVWHTRGQFNDPSIVSYPNLEWKFLKQYPTLDMIFNYNIKMVYFAFLFAIFGWLVMYHTPFGLRLRGVGINPAAAQAAGISVRKYRWIGLVIMGASMGLAGSYMPLCGMSLFSENMTRGRGFLCLTSILVGKGHPIRTMFIALLFGYANSMTLVLSTYGLPTQIISMLPYVMVLLVLLSVGIKNYRKSSDITSEVL